MSKHIAVIYIPFEIPKNSNVDPSEEADNMVRDIIAHGFGTAYLDDVFEPNKGMYINPMFTASALECGHGEDFRAVFAIRLRTDRVWVVESVDLQMLITDDDGVVREVDIGAVGGEIEMDVPTDLKTGAPDVEQLCHYWLGKWHREYAGKAEASVFGAFMIIKQIVSEGKFSNS